MRYLTTGDPVSNVWIFVNGYMQKSGKSLAKGTIVFGKKVSLNIGGHQRDFIQVALKQYLRPTDVIVASLNSSNAEGEATTPVVVPPIMKALPSIIGSVGFIWGLGYSFKKDKGFWAYVGYSFLGSVAGSAVGGLITVIAYPSTLDNLRKKSFSGFDGKRRGKSTQKQVKGNCTCPDGQRYPCTGARSCNECCHSYLD